MRLTDRDWQYVDERAQDFTGRAWVFERVRTFLASEARMLVIVAPPGTGKTAIAARLAQASAGRLADVPQLPVPAGTLDAAVFCQTGRVSLLEVARDLADQLSAALPGFDDEQRSTLAPQLTVSDVHVQTADVDAGASVSGVRIDLARLGPELAFDNGVALPLRRLANGAGFRPPVLLVDSLDEAFSSSVARSLPGRLAALTGVRLILTTRDDPRVLAQLGGLARAVASGQAEIVHLVDDAPADIDDVADYALARLRGQGSDDAIAVLARRIGVEAVGNFLYAYYVTRGLIESRALAALDANAARGLPLPADGLSGVYRDFLAREFGGDEDRWASRVRPILAPLAVALGDGLDTTQLAAIGSVLAGRSLSRSEARDVIRMAGQFLHGSQPDGPFRPYHQSFAEFLLDAKQNPDWPVDAAETHAAIVDGLIPRDAAGTHGRAAEPWEIDDWRAVDRYGMQHLAAHLGAVDPEGLARLLTSYQYIEAKLAALGFGFLLQDFEYAAPVLTGLDAERTIKLLRGALRLAGQAVLRNPAELPTQLIGRLSGLPEKPFQHLVAAARRSRSAPWLEPLRPSLAAPGGVFRVSLRGHEGTPRSVAISADGRIGATAGNSNPDQTVRVWDLDDGEELFVLREQASAGGYTPIALSGDGRLLMTAYGNEVRLWDLATGTSAATFAHHAAPVRAVAIAERSPVAATGDVDGIVLLWDLQRRELARRLRSELGGIHSVALTPDGLRLVVLADATLELWDMHGARLVQRRSVEPVVDHGWSLPIALSEDASSVVYGGRFWSVAADELRSGFQGYDGRPLAITIDGDRVLTAGLDNRGCDVWDLDGRLAWTLPDRDGMTSSGALSRDGRWALTAYYDHKVVAWDLDPAAPADGMASAAEPIRRVVIGADGRHAAAFAEAGASIWDLETGQAITGSARVAEALDAIRAQLATEDAIVGKLDAERMEADVRAGDDPEGDRPRPSEEGLGNFVHRDFYCHRWAAGAGGHLALHWLQPTAKTSEAEEHPRVDAGWHHYRVDVVNADRREPVVRLDGHSMHILDGAISADGRRVATGSIGRLVRVWNLPGGEMHSTLPAHRDPVSAVDLSGDGTLVVSASWDGSVRVWDLDGGRSVATFSGDSPMLACAISADGSRVVAGDRAGRVHLLRLRDARD